MSREFLVRHCGGWRVVARLPTFYRHLDVPAVLAEAFGFVFAEEGEEFLFTAAQLLLDVIEELILAEPGKPGAFEFPARLVLAATLRGCCYSAISIVSSGLERAFGGLAAPAGDVRPNAQRETEVQEFLSRDREVAGGFKVRDVLAGVDGVDAEDGDGGGALG